MGLGLAALASLALLELASRFAGLLGLLPARPRLTGGEGFYRDSDRAFGVWHAPNASLRVTTDCFDVEYRSNAYGARDRERARRSGDRRVVVLGDSFVEGIGVERSLRLTDLLEERTGREHLNFGTAGNFSSIQEWLLYRSLASEFDHEAVFVFMLPNNDFIENDPERFWEPARYRPYLRRGRDGFEVFYPTDFETARRRTQRQLTIWNPLYNASYSYRLFAALHAQLRARIASGGMGSEYGYVGYQQFTEEDLERIFFSYRRIRDLAAPRPVTIFSIPRLNEFRYFEREGFPERLPRRLAAFAASEPGLRYVDLMPGFIEDARLNGRSFSDYFHPCDGHWSPLGNQVAADVVLAADP